MALVLSDPLDRVAADAARGRGGAAPPLPAELEELCAWLRFWMPV